MQDRLTRGSRWLRPQVKRGIPIDDHEWIRADTISRNIEKIYGWGYNEIIAWIRLSGMASVGQVARAARW